MTLSTILGSTAVLAEPPGAVAPGAVAPGAAASAARPSNAQIEAGEPRADTSAPAPAPDPGAAQPSPSATARAATRPPTPRTPAAAGSPRPKGNDRVDLSTATVTGDREQPKVMYIVPWKRSDIGDLSGKPMNSLLDEALAPVDRDEFKREVVYYGAVKAASPENGPAKPGAGLPGAGLPAANQGEK